jgi:dCTP diphosphatase
MTYHRNPAVPLFTDRQIVQTMTMSIEFIQKSQAAFAAERDWEQFHTIRNLTLALVGEVGELAEVIQWEGEVTRDSLTSNSKMFNAFEEEIADVLLYVLRLADVAGIDIARAAENKIEKNARKYPVETSKGSSKKSSLDI